MKTFLVMALAIVSIPVTAQLSLPTFLSDGMVLQQKKVNRFWGRTTPQQLVTVSFNKKNYVSLANSNGEWQVFLDPSSPGNAGAITISSGKDRIVLNNILIGEVWVCSGQSNMEWKMRALPDTYKEELETASNDNIRFVVIEKTFTKTAQQQVALEKKWSAITPATIGDCSAVAYWFAKKLNRQLQVPIGLIVSSWGGTPAEAWTSLEGLHDFPHYISTFTEKVLPFDLESINLQRQMMKEKFSVAVSEKYEMVHAATRPGFDDANWKTMLLPKPWEAQGYPMLDGIVMFRIAFTVAEADAGREAILNLPAIDDMDSTYINGTFIGSINQWDAKRKYRIPAGVLKAGKNVLAIRVQDDQGGGGFSDAGSPFNITIDKTVIPLAGDAKFNIVAELEKVIGGTGDMEDQPTMLYNGMIAPLLPLSIRGVIWYQGEDNAGTNPFEYRTLFPAMINDWRNRWGQGDFPFLFVQLSSYGNIQPQPSSSAWAVLRESQALTLSLPNTAMAVTTDIGEPNNIHPQKKKEVGDRLADGAMKIVYGMTNTISSGPQLAGYAIRGKQVFLQFKNAGKGLWVKGKQLKHFAIAGADKKFIWADAVIKGKEIIVSSDKVIQPLSVRYAWADSPVDANLYNKEGYPAVPFRTDDWPLQ